ncbi:hypothetical protein [Streptomyces sp. 35G-GA-8]|uniref:hypothetical protein n=1 Tax=Streptomyces sp. 35G-GA-8 TaxID=2939434 RepID=UPI00201E9909|nr:hypothetical protein [Streptomyces sp. 35G-GA-8]MCL7382397.1 hypothetical protein [Streptomyces sp. 35G-GA-8]
MSDRMSGLGAPEAGRSDPAGPSDRSGLSGPPGRDVLAVPVRAVAETWGAAAVPALACAAAALGLLAHATVALSRASAHLSLSTTSCLSTTS